MVKGRQGLTRKTFHDNPTRVYAGDYHLTEDGPKRCSATKGKCPYKNSQHFSTNYGNEKMWSDSTKWDIQGANERNKREYFLEEFADQEKLFFRESEEGKDVLTFDFDDNKNLRDLRNELKNIRLSPYSQRLLFADKTFEYYNTKGEKTFEIRLERSVEPSDSDSDPLQVKTWNIITTDTNRGEPIVQNFLIREDKAVDGAIYSADNYRHNRNIIKTQEFLRSIMANTYRGIPEDDLNKIVNSMYNQISKHMNNIAYADGGNHNPKFFFTPKTDDSGETYYVANEDYNNSVIEPRDIIKFHEEVRRTSRSIEFPEVRFRVREENDGNEWAVEKHDEGLLLTLTNADGEKVEKVITNKDQATKELKPFLINNMNIEKPKSVLERVLFVGELAEKYVKEQQVIKDELTRRRENSAILKAQALEYSNGVTQPPPVATPKSSGFFSKIVGRK